VINPVPFLFAMIFTCFASAAEKAIDIAPLLEQIEMVRSMSGIRLSYNIQGSHYEGRNYNNNCEINMVSNVVYRVSWRPDPAAVNAPNVIKDDLWDVAIACNSSAFQVLNRQTGQMSIYSLPPAKEVKDLEKLTARFEDLTENCRFPIPLLEPINYLALSMADHDSHGNGLDMTVLSLSPNVVESLMKTLVVGREDLPDGAIRFQWAKPGFNMGELKNWLILRKDPSTGIYLMVEQLVGKNPATPLNRTTIKYRSISQKEKQRFKQIMVPEILSCVEVATGKKWYHTKLNDASEPVNGISPADTQIDPVEAESVFDAATNMWVETK